MSTVRRRSSVTQGRLPAARPDGAVERLLSRQLSCPTAQKPLLVHMLSASSVPQLVRARGGAALMEAEMDEDEEVVANVGATVHP